MQNKAHYKEHLTGKRQRKADRGYTILCLLFMTILAAFCSQNSTFAKEQEVISLYQEDVLLPAEEIQYLLDTELAAQAGNGAEWYVFSLRQSGIPYNYTKYLTALIKKWDASENISIVTKQKYALLLCALGYKEDVRVTETMEAFEKKQGIMSEVFALHLFNQGISSEACTREELVNALLSRKLSDGGFAIYGEQSDVDVTAMVLQAIAPYEATDKAVHQVIVEALSFLSDRQQEDGDFISYGEANAESTAQVMIALSALSVDETRLSLFTKNGKTIQDGLQKYKLPDGTYAHTAGGESSVSATSQAYLAETAYMRMEKGLPSVFLFNDTDGMTAGSVLPDIDRTESSHTGSTQAESNQAGSNQTESSRTDEGKAVSPYQWIATAVIWVLALLSGLLLWIRKKRHYQNYLVLGAAAVFLTILVFVTDIQSRDAYYRAAGSKENAVGKVTMTIRCDTAVNQLDYEWLPEDGVILAEKVFEIAEGDTAYDILTEAAKTYQIQIETKSNGYVSGIAYLYEFALGELSGWMYYLNGEVSSVGSNRSVLKDGDSIAWLYTCEMGRDLEDQGQ